MMNWYSSGFSGVEESTSARKAEIERLKKQPRRVMLKVGETANFIFIDDIAFTYDEHKIVPPGPDGWKNTTYRTCIGAARGCPDCHEGHRANRMVAFTVIDRRKWTDKEGKPHENERRILILRDDVALELKKKMLTWGGLKNKEVIISRVGDRSPNTGNSFDVVRDKDHQPVTRDMVKAKQKNPALEIEPYDYADILAPIYKPGSTSARSVSTGSISSSNVFENMDSDNPFSAESDTKIDDDIAF